MFDIGVNLTSTQFAKDRDQVVKRAREAGVTGLLITGTNAGEPAGASAGDPARGLLLVDRRRAPASCQRVVGGNRQYAAPPADSEQVVAIGECGLDFNRNLSAHEQQEYAFDAQLQLAAEAAAGVLHCREAHERFLAVLQPWLPKLVGAVVHCFTGTRDELEACRRWVYRWALPAGCVMNGAEWRCVTCCR